MDLRTFFGDWSVNQRVLISQGGTRYVAEVKEFDTNKVVISTSSEGQTDSFYFSLNVDPNGNNASYYSVKILPGSGITPSYLAGDNIFGTTLLSSPLPPTLILSGTFKYFSNTLEMNVQGKMNISQNARNSELSELTIEMSHPVLDIAPLQFFGEYLEK